MSWILMFPYPFNIQDLAGCDKTHILHGNICLFAYWLPLHLSYQHKSWKQSFLVDFQQNMNALHRRADFSNLQYKNNNFNQIKIRCNVLCHGLSCLSYHEEIKLSQWLPTKQHKIILNGWQPSPILEISESRLNGAKRSSFNLWNKTQDVPYIWTVWLWGYQSQSDLPDS